ncbi:MAG TPA: hypothetical protein VGJ27_09315, partial [Gaiellaceae bacterium]
WECQELEPGRYRVSFVLGRDASVYIGLARLLQWVRNWRATEVYGEEVLEVERAVRDMLGEDPIPPVVLEITYGPRLRALLRGELDKLAQELEEDWKVPDFPPKEWGEPEGEGPPAGDES